MVKIAVVGGTPVDTAMGVEFLRKNAPELETLPIPVADSPHAEQLFQLSSPANKDARLSALFSTAEAQGVRDFFIYCNSLSASFDFEGFAARRGVRVYTPLQIYRALGRDYGQIAVIAANGQSAAGIESALYEENPDAQMMILGILALVNAVEQQEDPAQIVQRLHLPELTRFFEDAGAECLILGCTHFPYIRAALAPYTRLPMIDPADAMLARLRAAVEGKPLAQGQ